MSPKKYRYCYWTDPRTEVRPSLIQGQGLFAREPILAGEVVEILGGTLMTQAEFETFLATAKRFNAVQIAEATHLVERPEVTKARGGSVNHSCDSNLWMADEVTVVARRDISAGEELTIDYALHTANPDWELDGPCNCGSPLCRGTVRGSDWRLPEVQERYRGHFSPFTNERIATIDNEGGA
jgi:SET domain-containing protein